MKTALAKYNTVAQAANAVIAGDPRTRPGRESMKRQAQTELPVAEKALGAAFRKVGFPVFLNGTETKTFADIAADLAECVTVDFAQATAEVQNAVNASMGVRHREFSPAIFSVMVREIRQVAASLGLTSIPDIAYDGVEYVATPAALAGHVNKYILKYLGADFLAAIIEKQALEHVKKLTGDAPVIPVLISNFDVDLQDAVGAKLFQGKFLAVDTTEALTEKTVTDVFKHIRTIRKQA